MRRRHLMGSATFSRTPAIVSFGLRAATDGRVPIAVAQGVQRKRSLIRPIFIETSGCCVRHVASLPKPFCSEDKPAAEVD